MSLLTARRWTAPLLVGGALIGLLALLGPTLSGHQRLAFRDVGHFYGPLYPFLGQADSFLPRWNPFDHTGIPVAGEATTAIFYPPRWVFASGLPGHLAMGWYVAFHLALALATSGGLARRLGCTRASSIVGGITYAFSGPVLFLYCNPPFLVGAAWAPLALGASLALTRPLGPASPESDGARVRAFWRRRGCDTVGAAVALACCTLGGDPQTTVHVAMLVLGALLWRQVRYWRSGKRSQSDRSPDVRTMAAERPRWLPVLAAAALAALLAAPQIAAALDWSRQSARRYEPPAGISRQGAGPSVRTRQPWWQPPPAETHAAQIYAYSVPPWQWIDLVIPFASGELYPRYERLTALLPSHGRVWAVTLYAGALPLLAWLARCRWLRRQRRRPRDAQGEGGDGEGGDGARADFWDALIPVGLLLALGSFGPVWGFKELAHGLGIDGGETISDALFSPYWVLVNLLPGYGAFRYPAKWLPWVMLGISVATARCLSHLDATTREDLARMAKGLASAAVGFAVLALLLRWGRGWFGLGPIEETLPADAFWGPLSIEGAAGRWLRSSGQLFCVAVALAWLFRRPPGRLRDWTICIAGGLLIVELVLVGRGPVATVEVAAERRLLEALAATAEPLENAHRLLRTREGNGWPAAWRRTSSEQRILEVEASSRHTLFGRWHLEHRIGVLNSATSLVSQRVEAFWRAAKTRAEQLPEADRPHFWRAVLAPLAVDGVLQRTAQGIPSREEAGQPLVLADRRFEPLAGAAPQVRWSPVWQTVRPRAAVSTDDWMRLFGRWQRAGVDAVPVLETDDPDGAKSPSRSDQSANRAKAANAVTRGAVRRLDGSADHWDTDAFMLQADAPGLLTISRYQDGHWHARYRASNGPWRALPVYRVDYLGQGVVLPAGAWQVRFEYRPWWWLPTIVLALLAWALLGLACLLALGNRIAARLGR